MARLIYVILCLVLFLIPIAIVAPLPVHYKRRANCWIYRVLARAFRIKVTLRGKTYKDAPVIFVSNHMSYADIIALGAALPGNFISKSEVKKWPLFGWIASLSGTVFIDRKRGSTGDQLGNVGRALNDGKNLILFPEGTTSDGKGVMPFKSSLFKIVEQRAAAGQKITVQPVTLSYTHINGLPLQANERTKIAWVGDAEFLPHLMEFVNMGMIRAEVKIHEPLEIKGDRKQLAEAAHDVVAEWKS